MAVPGFVVPLIAAAPAATLLIADLARFERHFRHEGVFFGLVAGLIAGFLLVIVEALFGAASGRSFLVFVAPLLEAMALVAIVGMPRFRNQPPSVWYGGATALALVSVLLLGDTQGATAVRETGRGLLMFVLAAVGATLVYYAAGIAAGYGASRNKVLRMVVVCYALLLPASFFQEELDQGGAGLFEGAALWAVLMLVYGAVVAYVAAGRGHAHALPVEAKRAARRDARRRLRGD